MVTLKIDDKTFAVWKKQAFAQGLSVEEWLKGQTNVLPTDEDNVVANDLWCDRLQAFAHRHRSTGTALDDSRESIYE